jgi:hypothetical protein
MTRYLGMAIMLALVPIGTGAAHAAEAPSSGQILSYPTNQGYIQRSYPQSFDQEYRLPTQYGNQYYQQEPEGVVGYYGNQRTARDDSNSYNQKYYYYY